LSRESKAEFHIVQITSADEEGNKKAAKQVEELAGRVDVLWANAGKSNKGGIRGFRETDHRFEPCLDQASV
jgi:NAD(P)-dependent dehydrogenase (short-subunit alcohol dehydrogenase family)